MKITADGDCSHKIKRCLLLGRKAMTNLNSILKIRDITFLPKGHLVKARVKNLPAMQETWVQFLGQEDSPGEGNGNPLQYSCLENPMDGGAW